MSSATLYNDNDPKVAAWLRALIEAGHLPPGDVDARSIADFDAAALGRARTFHAFAGIGGWPYALRLAGWPDDFPVWTASLPCQPWSAAGKRLGAADPRHLAPVWLAHVAAARPDWIFGEQVAGRDGLVWLSALHPALEAMGYLVGAVDTGAAGIGAPHIRQRLFFGAVRLADARGARLEVGERVGGIRRSPMGAHTGEATVGCGDACRLADAPSERWHRRRAGQACDEPGALERSERLRDAGGLGGANCRGRQPGQPSSQAARHRSAAEPDGSLGLLGHNSRTSPLHGLWRDADWLLCRDGRWRPVGPGTFPLAHGIPARVVRLRGFGNAIVPALAAAFVRTFVGAVDDLGEAA